MNTSSAININELIIQLEEAKHGKAKVDKNYVEYDNNENLFKYNIDFIQFIDDITHILKKENNE
jgi:hypothetical protein